MTTTALRGLAACRTQLARTWTPNPLTRRTQALAAMGRIHTRINEGTNA